MLRIYLYLHLYFTSKNCPCRRSKYLKFISSLSFLLVYLVDYFVYLVVDLLVCCVK